VDIEEGPYIRAVEAESRQFEGVHWEQVERSKEAGDYFESWDSTPELELVDRMADLNPAVATTLAPLGPEVTARLMYHGYLQAMIMLFVQLGYPLLYPRPTVHDFLNLANGIPRTSQPGAAPSRPIVDSNVLHEAYQRGDLETLSALLGDPPDFPNCRGPKGREIILQYAIYHSPLRFIQALLELGADPNYQAGFPSLIDALSSLRTDRYEIFALLLKFGAGVEKRTAHDVTPLHYAAEQGI
jgi:hypothetical protein